MSKTDRSRRTKPSSWAALCFLHMPCASEGFEEP